jgi:hypothetical protein
MKSAIVKGLAVALLQLVIVGSLAAKFAHDRATCPRVWVRTAYYDPDLPIRGRYASLQLEVDAPGVFQEKPLVEQKPTPYEIMHPSKEAADKDAKPDKPRYVPVWDSKPVRLEVQDGKLIAMPDPKSNISARYMRNTEGRVTIALQEPVDIFVPEHAANLPGWQWPRPNNIEWWAEVTVPKKGSPRPIRLGIKQAGGQIMPLPQG